MPTRKVRRLSTTSARAPKPSQQDIGRIAAQRDRLMQELARLREDCASPAVIDNVRQLLTRWWSPANWRAREDLLRTAEWFLQLERTGTGNGETAEKHFAIARPDF